MLVWLNEQDLAYLIEALEDLGECNAVRGNRRWQATARKDMDSLKTKLERLLGVDDGNKETLGG